MTTADFDFEAPSAKDEDWWAGFQIEDNGGGTFINNSQDQGEVDGDEPSDGKAEQSADTAGNNNNDHWRDQQENKLKGIFLSRRRSVGVTSTTAAAMPTTTDSNNATAPTPTSTRRADRPSKGVSSSATSTSKNGRDRDRSKSRIRHPVGNISRTLSPDEETTRTTRNKSSKSPMARKTRRGERVREGGCASREMSPLSRKPSRGEGDARRGKAKDLEDDKQNRSGSRTRHHHSKNSMDHSRDKHISASRKPGSPRRQMGRSKTFDDRHHHSFNASLEFNTSAKSPVGRSVTQFQRRRTGDHTAASRHHHSLDHQPSNSPSSNVTRVKCNRSLSGLAVGTELAEDNNEDRRQIRVIKRKDSLKGPSLRKAIESGGMGSAAVDGNSIDDISIDDTVMTEEEREKARSNKVMLLAAASKRDQLRRRSLSFKGGISTTASKSPSSTDHRNRSTKVSPSSSKSKQKQMQKMKKPGHKQSKIQAVDGDSDSGNSYCSDSASNDNGDNSETSLENLAVQLSPKRHHSRHNQRHHSRHDSTSNSGGSNNHASASGRTRLGIESLANMNQQQLNSKSQL